MENLKSRSVICYMLLLLYVVRVDGTTNDCTRIEDSDYIDFKTKNRYYGYGRGYSYEEYLRNRRSQGIEPEQHFTCYNIDISYLTWILPPDTHNLAYFKCVSCKFNERPIKLPSYDSLNDLSIMNSSLLNVTKEMFAISSLRDLSVTGSNVTYVENDSFNLGQLKYLNLSHNKIDNIFLSNSTITTLDLSFNLLQNASFPITLETLLLQSNELVITKGIFTGLHELIFLDISSNNLAILDAHIFSDLTSLKILNVSHNNLLSVDYGTFSGLHNLLTLNITYNFINIFPEYVFHDINNLNNLYINNNNFSDLDASLMIANLPSLMEISINENYWKCDVLSLSIRLLKSKNIQILPGTCKTTPNIIKICCIESGSSVLENSENVSDAINKFYNRDFTNSNFYNFFAKDYEQQNFWKYFNSDYKQSGLFRFFDKGFLQSQFYKYLNDNHFNVTFQNKIIDKIDELRDSLRTLFSQYFFKINATGPIEPFARNAQSIQYATPSHTDVLVGVMITIIVLLILYVIYEKCKFNTKSAVLDKLRLYRMFRSRSTTVNEQEIEIV